MLRRLWWVIGAVRAPHRLRFRAALSRPSLIFDVEVGFLSLGRFNDVCVARCSLVCCAASGYYTLYATFRRAVRMRGNP